MKEKKIIIERQKEGTRYRYIDRSFKGIQFVNVG